ncbi:unnamed protein product [Adineta steineri]|uniref:Uncharacterized protein n=1 Tax=Adineta steineri TaxID=433720 RepID=A0A814P9D9_9BILA|nr:unnamed protein product [Adineta steineri]CAF1280151.1 unnamed protein product [Adineta steineri]
MEELNFKLKHLDHEHFLQQPLQTLANWKTDSIRAIDQFYEQKQQEVLELNKLNFTKYQDKINDLKHQLNITADDSADNSRLENLHDRYKSLEVLLNITVVTKSISIDGSFCLFETCDDDQLLLKSEPKLKRKETNLESHQLIWLKSNEADTSSVIESITSLQKVFGHTIVFNDIEQCLKLLEETKDTTTFLVCSQNLTDDVLSKIHHSYFNILRTYVYCYDDERRSNQKHNLNFPEVKHVYTQLNQLVNDLSEDVQTYLKHERITSSFLDLTNEGRTAAETDITGWPCLIATLSSLSYPDDCCHRLVHCLKEFYSDNPAQITVLDEFQSNYTSSDALRWYTRDSFLFRLINRALRQHNIELIFLFGFYIKDLYLQLEDANKYFQTETSFTVYRGQQISRVEIKNLQKWEFISNNSFLSTTRQRSLATVFLNQSAKLEDECQSILFEIQVDCRQLENIFAPPFADISTFSQFPEECEILFLNGTQFQIVEVVFSRTENFWIAKLELTSNSHLGYGYEYDEILPITKKTILKKCLRRFPDRLNGMSLDDIDSIFTQLLNLYPTEKWLMAFKFWCIAGYYHRHLRTDKNYNVILKYYKVAIDILTEMNDDECLIDLGKLYEATGHCYYHFIGDTTEAQKHYHIAANYFESVIEKGLLKPVDKIFLEHEIAPLRLDFPSVLFTNQDPEEEEDSPDSEEISWSGVHPESIHSALD